MTETEQLLKLSLIYTRLLRELEEMSGGRFESIHRATQAVSDAFDEARAVRNAFVADGLTELFGDGVRRNDCAWDSAERQASVDGEDSGR